PCRLPAVAIHTVGAGGGSVGWVDAGGALRVGPRSAGATPGPACYGKGGREPAVTDANLMLGRLDPEVRLAGSLPVRLEAARATLGRVGEHLGLTPEAVAMGMVEVVETVMFRAVRRVSVEEGSDPRRAVLVAFGGAGGMHATALARRLDMAGVVVPPFAGVFSALGLLLSPPRADAARTVLLTRDRSSGLDGAVAGVAAQAEAELRGFGSGAPRAVTTLVDARYRGQSPETAVRYRPGDGWDALEASFHEAHRIRNGFARPGDPVEAVTVRAEAVGEPALRWGELPEITPRGQSRQGDRQVLTGDGPVTAGVWWRPGLGPGDEVVGPAVIEEPEATTYLAAGETATVHPSGTLQVEW
ncbi:MAG: hydantoinase/oxoprolinase family protein, partial [Acidimicrobiia bacterium]